jgi:hypothetical protein
MGESKGGRPTPRWPLEPSATSGSRGPAAAGKDSATPKQPDPAGPTGRVKHDSRGNAIWDWAKETGRICIENTFTLLKKLETPDLKMEDDNDPKLRVESDRDSGGGYDPYNQRTQSKGKTPGRK